MNPQRGEIWTADLGMAAKVRPVLVLSMGYRGAERAVASFVNRTLSVRGTRYEIPHGRAYGLEAGAFDCQGLATLPAVKFIRRLGLVDNATLAAVENGVRE